MVATTEDNNLARTPEAANAIGDALNKMGYPFTKVEHSFNKLPDSIQKLRLWASIGLNIMLVTLMISFRRKGQHG